MRSQKKLKRIEESRNYHKKNSKRLEEHIKTLEDKLRTSDAAFEMAQDAISHWRKWYYEKEKQKNFFEVLAIVGWGLVLYLTLAIGFLILI